MPPQASLISTVLRPQPRQIIESIRIHRTGLDIQGPSVFANKIGGNDLYCVNGRSFV